MNHIKMSPGHHRVMPYFLVNDADAFITFLQDVLGATERECHRDEKGGVMHAEYDLGGSVLMVGQSTEQWAERPTACYLYVADTDATHAACLKAGCTEIYAPRDEHYGVRGSGILDRWGNTWWLARML